MLLKSFTAAREHFLLHKKPRTATPQNLQNSSSGVNGVDSEHQSKPETPEQSQDSELPTEEQHQQTEDAQFEDNDAGYIKTESGKRPSRIVDLTFKMFSIGVVISLIISLAVVESRDTGNITSDTYFYGDSPPVYPSPKGTGGGSWTAAYARAAALVSRMSLQEKNFLTAGTLSINNGCSGNIRGVDRVKFPGMCLSDAGNGLRSADFVNAYPAGLHAGASWNKELTRRRAVHMGLEFRKKGVNVALGPVVGPLGRVTTGGRNWEGFGADPYLSGQLAFQHVQGMQGVGVITSTKHFIGNEQELWRNPGTIKDVGKIESVSSNIDDRTMHELYLWPFQDAVRAGSGCIMCSYQRINNSYGCQNSKTLNGLLKEELGFQGFVVSDWFAQHAGYAGALAGMDMVMPYTNLWGKKFLTAINNGSMHEGRLNDMATRTLAAWYQMGQDSEDFPKPGFGMPGVLTKPHKPVDARSPSSKSVLREGAREGHVLVKNNDNILPLKKPKLLSLFGYDALAETSLSLSSITVAPPVDSQIARFNLWVGGGSGANAPAYLSDPFSALSQKAFEDDTSLIWDFESNKPLVNGASDACLVFLNAFASEGYDRPGIQDDESDRLVENVAKSCENTIVVMHNAGTRTVGSWADNENVKAIIFGHLPGQDSGRALVDLLYGKESFSGKLPYTVARRPQDYGKLLYHAKPSGRFEQFPQSDFSEGVYIDYRAFEKKRLTPRYPFGFGLTYTTFNFSGLSVSTVSSDPLSTYPPDAPIQQGGNPRLFDVIATAACTVANTGKMAAMEVAQLYVGIPDAPAKQLRGFEKVLIDPGAGTTVTFNLTRRDLSIWDTKKQAWKLQSGMYKFYVGNSVDDVPLKRTLSI